MPEGELRKANANAKTAGLMSVEQTQKADGTHSSYASSWIKSPKSRAGALPSLSADSKGSSGRRKPSCDSE